MPQSREIIDLSADSDTESRDDPLPFANLTRIQVTPRLAADYVEHISSAPEYWPVPSPAEGVVVYVLDMRNNPPECLVNGKVDTVDGFIKKECQDSWRGSTGSKYDTVLVSLLDNQECRRSILYCNGCNICSFADPSFLKDFKRWDPERQTRSDLTTQVQMERRELEANSATARTIFWYRSIISNSCSAIVSGGGKCGGRPTLRTFSNPNRCGQKFVGCSNWAFHSTTSKKHYFCAIPHEVDRDILEKLFSNQPLYHFANPTKYPASYLVYQDVKPLLSGCTNIIHPASMTPSRECGNIHFAVGGYAPAPCVRHACPAKLTILTPLNTDDYRAVVIPEDSIAHTHPTFPARKVPHSVKEHYRDCIKAFGGPLGATTSKIDNAPSTRVALEGKTPQELHPSLNDNRKRRKILLEERVVQFPKGTDIEGVLHEFNKSKSLEINERYIHGLYIDDGSHVIITLHPPLISYIWSARWLMVDTTFKVVHGATNEFKVVIWNEALNRRLVVGRVWTSTATRSGFFLVWNGLWEAIKKIGGKELNFKIFSGSSSLLGVIGDAEGAQAQGFSDMVTSRRLYGDSNSVYTVNILRDPDEVLFYLWKTCLVHFDRGILNLRGHVDDPMIEFLRSFPRLESKYDIEKYKATCEHASLKNKKINGWWTHKKSYNWLLPSLNQLLSKMDKAHWNLMPSNTNLVEGSHAGDNLLTEVNRPLLEAILLAKAADEKVARSLQTSIQSGVLANCHNSTQQRYVRQNQRRNHAREKQISTAISKNEEFSLKTQIKELRGRLKLVQEESKKVSGRGNSTTRKRKASEIASLDVVDEAENIDPTISNSQVGRDVSLKHHTEPSSLSLHAPPQPPSLLPVDGDPSFLISDPYPNLPHFGHSNNWDFRC
ncbi:hypothetical protein NP233_g6361 [Leucocoprinus birnbaumii]|uniref:Uncharacterized protein n=1 Tax=Leucocoprinus birnbaumii TaxID=56174 RepID=A0AAD5VUN5_9AGAR|nr:hypothetical protein NP233_g6361 [Leucocoprinus birnbaumii]